VNSPPRTRGRFSLQPGFPVAGRGGLCDSRASAHLCSPGCCPGAGAVCPGRGAAGSRLQPCRPSPSSAPLGHSQAAAATRVTPQGTGEGASGACGRALALGPHNAFSRESGEMSSVSPGASPCAKPIACACRSPVCLALCQPRAVQG